MYGHLECLTFHQSARTLRDYSNYIQTKSGYQHEVMEQLCNEAKIETLDDTRKHVSILVKGQGKSGIQQI